MADRTHHFISYENEHRKITHAIHASDTARRNLCMKIICVYTVYNRLNLLTLSAKTAAKMMRAISARKRTIRMMAYCTCSTIQ